MPPSEIDLIRQIDRSEIITQEYIFEDGELFLKDACWDVPRWSEDGAGHSAQVRHGFQLAEEVNKELYKLEPADIHMVKELA